MSIEPLHTLGQDVRNEIARCRGELDRLRSEISAWVSKLVLLPSLSILAFSTRSSCLENLYSSRRRRAGGL
jgi:hypothetical protein